MTENVRVQLGHAIFIVFIGRRPIVRTTMIIYTICRT